MFDSKSIDLLKQLEEVELDNAINQFGAKYNSIHEAYAVLHEEIDEAEDELKHIISNLSELWELIKKDENDGLDSIIQKVILISLASDSLILEGSQVHAVCKKFIATLKGGMNEQ